MAATPPLVPRDLIALGLVPFISHAWDELKLELSGRESKSLRVELSRVELNWVELKVGEFGRDGLSTAITCISALISLHIPSTAQFIFSYFSGSWCWRMVSSWHADIKIWFLCQQSLRWWWQGYFHTHFLTLISSVQPNEINPSMRQWPSYNRGESLNPRLYLASAYQRVPWVVCYFKLSIVCFTHRSIGTGQRMKLWHNSSIFRTIGVCLLLCDTE